MNLITRKRRFGKLFFNNKLFSGFLIRTKRKRYFKLTNNHCGYTAEQDTREQKIFDLTAILFLEMIIEEPRLYSRKEGLSKNQFSGML